MAQQQTDIITEARNNLAGIDKEIEAAREQVHTLNAKIENLQRSKAQDEALIRIVEMHAAGKDLSALLASVSKPARETRTRAPRQSGAGGSRGNTDDVRSATREYLTKEGSGTIDDIIKYLVAQGIELSGGDDEAKRKRNTQGALKKDDTIKLDNGVYSLG